VETVTLGQDVQQHGQFVALTIYPRAEEDSHIKIVRISGRMAFMNAASLRDKLFRLVDRADTPYRDVVFDLTGVSSIDLTAILALTDVLLEAEKHDIRLHLANVPKETQSNLRMSGLLEHMGGEEWCRRTVEEVYAEAKRTRGELDANPRPKRRQADDGHH
jgi:anti-anti-sigma factor